jgi:hypothetical protein
MITIINISIIISCLVGDTYDLKVVQNGVSTTIDPMQIFVYYKLTLHMWSVCDGYM